MVRYLLKTAACGLLLVETVLNSIWIRIRIPVSNPDTKLTECRSRIRNKQFGIRIATYKTINLRNFPDPVGSNYIPVNTAIEKIWRIFWRIAE
jgi:hypothetical protein